MEKSKKSIGAIIGENGAYIALVLLVIVISVISPEFRTADNFLNLLRQASFNGLIAFGMTCVILSDGIDLSVPLCAVQLCALFSEQDKSHNAHKAVL